MAEVSCSRIRRLMVCSLLCAGAVAASAAAPAATDAQVLLAASDAIRNPGQPFSLAVSLTEYRAGKQTDANSLQVYSRADPQGGQFRTLVRFVAPARDLDKLMLKSGNELWFYDPASRASVRISPQQRLLGQAANGDVVTVNFAQAYRARLEQQEEVQDGDRQLRQCDRLALEAATPDVTYHSVQMWLDHANQRPVKARFFSESGRLLKTAFYRRYREELGVQRPTEIVIIDGLDPSLVTVMRYGEFVAREVPESWLQRDYLPRFRPE